MTPDLSLLPDTLATEAQERGQDLERQDAAALFAEHCDYVWNTLRRLGVAHDDLEDLSHDTFVAVFRQWHSYDQARPLRPWLFGFALRVASDHRRRARHRLEVAGDGHEPADQAPGAVELLLQREREALAQQALQGIELARRAVFILHELDGSTLPEIAAALEIPLGTATSRLRLAREDFASSVKRLRLAAR
jgi:RNA polymerase sigma-70 factor (ECF subfamily)